VCVCVAPLTRTARLLEAKLRNLTENCKAPKKLLKRYEITTAADRSLFLKHESKRVCVCVCPYLKGNYEHLLCLNKKREVGFVLMCEAACSPGIGGDAASGEDTA